MTSTTELLTTLPLSSWDEMAAPAIQSQVLQALEQGQLLLLPQLAFTLKDHERRLISPEFSDKKAKNISYDSSTNKLKGACGTSEELQHIKEMVARFNQQAHALIAGLLPSYNRHLQIARTSFRPCEITDRKLSYRKDDKRLHVDAFPATPNQGKRILRVFSNINLNGEPRIWRIGEPFDVVAQRFLPKIPRQIPGSSQWLQRFKITKSRRSEYDHIMLQMHNRMKKDDRYQQNVPFTELALPAGSTWIVQTDQVSHAALSGQHLLEQTFYLPVEAMAYPQTSPLKVLERMMGRVLI